MVYENQYEDDVKEEEYDMLPEEEDEDENEECEDGALLLKIASKLGDNEKVISLSCTSSYLLKYK